MNTPDHTPLVTVVILSMNKMQDILECIRSIKGQSYRNYNIIIVDNGSTDGTPDAIEQAHPDIHIIRNASNRGISTGRNQGFRAAQELYSPQFLLMLDNDIRLEPRYMECMLDAVRGDDTVALACGKVYTAYPSTTLASAGINVNLWTGVIRDRGFGEQDHGQFDEPAFVGAASGFNTLARMDILANIGGWDERYDPYGWDDAEIGIRIRREGYRIAYVPGARLYHKGTRLNRSPLPGYERSKIVNYFRLVREFASLPQRVTIFLLLPFRWTALAAGYVLGGQGRIIATHVGTLYNVVRGRSS